MLVQDRRGVGHGQLLTRAIEKGRRFGWLSFQLNACWEMRRSKLQINDLIVHAVNKEKRKKKKEKKKKK